MKLPLFLTSIFFFCSCNKSLHSSLIQNTPCSAVAYKDTNEIKLIQNAIDYNRLKAIISKTNLFFFYLNENITIPLLAEKESVFPCIFFGAGDRLRHSKTGSTDVVIGSKDIKVTNCSSKTYTIKQVKTNGGGVIATNINSFTDKKQILLKSNESFTFQIILYAHAGFDASLCLIVMKDELGNETVQYIDIISSFNE